MVAVEPTFNMAEFRKGSPDAISQLFEMYYRSLVYYAYNIIDNRSEAEDIVSDCYIKMMSKLEHFENLLNIKAFLYVATRNACYNYLQYLKVDARSQRELAYLHNPMQPGLGADYALMDTEVVQAVLEEVENLPRQCQQIFRYLYFQHKSTREVADLMGLSVKTVRNQKSRAVQLLHTALLKKNLLTAAMFLQVLFDAGQDMH